MQNAKVMMEHSPSFTAIIWTLAFVLIVVRLWIRKWVLRRPLEYSDCFAVLALCIFTGDVGTNIWYIKNHDLRYSEPGLVLVLKMQFVNVALYCARMTAVKATFVAAYRTMLPRLERAYSVGLVFMAAYLAVGFVISESLYVFWCRPVRRNWDVNDFCTSFLAPRPVSFVFAHGITADLMIMLFPLLLLRHLRIGRRETIAFFILLGIGCVSAGASIGRFALIVAPAPSKGSKIGLMTALEFVCGLIASCVPTYRVLLKSLFTDETGAVDDDHRDMAAAKNGDGDDPDEEEEEERRRHTVSVGWTTVLGPDVLLGSSVRTSRPPEEVRVVGIDKEEVVQAPGAGASEPA